MAEGGDVRIDQTAAALFGDRLPLARRYADTLATVATVRGLIGPREGERLWSRHLLNCAVVGELLSQDCVVLDVGSGAGLPGIVLAIARPDLQITLVEPLLRRAAFLGEVVQSLDLPVQVVRGRAEDAAVLRDWAGADVVTARAVAPLARLMGWCLPLTRPGGRVLAIKGASAAVELARDEAAVRRAGAAVLRLHQCGVGVIEQPTAVVEAVRRGVSSERVR